MPQTPLRGRLAAVIIVAALALAACAATEESPSSLAVVTVPQDAATLTEAHELVEPGGVIFIEPGTYEEQLLVTKDDVTIRGLDRNDVVIDGGGLRPYGIVVVSDGVRVENLTVRNATFYGVLVTGLHDENGPSAHTATGYEPFDPAAFPPVERFAVNYVTAHNNGLYGIYAFNARDGVITNSYASGSADSGFYVGQCVDCNILVEGNVAERNAVGFENANASGPLAVVGNRFSDNRVGLTLLSNYQEAFTPQRDNYIAGNVISNNVNPDSPSQESGGWGTGIGISGGQDNLITANLIAGNDRAGIVIANTEDLASVGNSFAVNAFEANGVDVANVSAARAPASENCATDDETLSAVPAELFDDCTATQPNVATTDLPAQDVPLGVSFLRVAAPIAQPQMPDVEDIPGPLPTSIAFPAVDAFDVPAADYLADRTGTV